MCYGPQPSNPAFRRRGLARTVTKRSQQLDTRVYSESFHPNLCARTAPRIQASILPPTECFRLRRTDCCELCRYASQDAPRSISRRNTITSLKDELNHSIDVSSLGSFLAWQSRDRFYVFEFPIPPHLLTFHRCRHRGRGELAVKAPIRITSPSIDAYQSVGPTPTPSQIPKATAFNPAAPCLDEVPQVYRSLTSISSFLDHQFGVFSDSMAPFPSHIAETISASQRSF